MKTIIAIFLCILTAGLAVSSQLETTILDVVDGNTVVIQTNAGPKTVNIAGYESPSPGQPFFHEAKELTIKIINNKPVTIKHLRNHKDIVTLTPSNYKNLPIAHIANGLGWVVKPIDQNLKQMETKARMKKIGVWSKPNNQSVLKQKSKIAKKRQGSIAIGTAQPATKIYGDSAADIKKDADGTAVGHGGGFSGSSVSIQSKRIYTNDSLSTKETQKQSSSPKYRRTPSTKSNAVSSTTTIRTNCQNKWETNYRMVKFCIDEQTKALRTIASRSNNSTIQRDCETKWGTNFRMVKFCIDEQSKAKRIVENVASNPTIQRNCENKWKNNFRMVKFCINEQSNAQRIVESGVYDSSKIRSCTRKWGDNYRMVQFCAEN